mgnify:CR=1 FL=1
MKTSTNIHIKQQKTKLKKNKQMQYDYDYDYVMYYPLLHTYNMNKMNSKFMIQNTHHNTMI